MDRLRLAVIGLSLAVAACGSDPVSLTTTDVAGTYLSTRFEADGVDILSAGGSLVLVLAIDGMVSGSMVIPAEIAGEPLDVDMAGTYTVDGDRLSFQQSGDSFVRDAEWTWSDGVLEGNYRGTGDVFVRLARQ